MRVVFLTHNYPRFEGDVAGAFLHPLAVALVRRGIDVRVVAPSDRGNGGRNTLDGVPIHRVRYGAPSAETLGYGGTILTALQSPSAWFGLAALFRTLRKAALEECGQDPSSVVHAHWWIPGGLASPPSIPLVLTCHGTDVRIIQQNSIARRISWSTLHRARVVTTVSSALADALRSSGKIPVHDRDIVPMPVAAINRPLTTGGKGIVVLGRLSSQKRVHLAIDAYAAMRSRGCLLPLSIVGDGPTRSELQAQVATLGLGASVTFTGAIPPAQVPTVFGGADLCIMPAIGEGLGLAAAEAMMQGVPVVACSDGGGVLDVVPPVGAGRVAEPTSTSLAEAALNILADPGAKSAAAEVGRVWQARLDPNAVAERCVEWYQRARA